MGDVGVGERADRVMEMQEGITGEGITGQRESRNALRVGVDERRVSLAGRSEAESNRDQDEIPKQTKEREEEKKIKKGRPSRRDRMPSFSTLTGLSPAHVDTSGVRE